MVKKTRRKQWDKLPTSTPTTGDRQIYSSINSSKNSLSSRSQLHKICYCQAPDSGNPQDAGPTTGAELWTWWCDYQEYIGTFQASRSVYHKLMTGEEKCHFLTSFGEYMRILIDQWPPTDSQALREVVSGPTRLDVRWSFKKHHQDQ